MIFILLRLIRLSSYNLNYLIGCGAVILYMDTYFFIIPTTNPQAVAALCNVCYSESIIHNCGFRYVEMFWAISELRQFNIISGSAKNKGRFDVIRGVKTSTHLENPVITGD